VGTPWVGKNHIIEACWQKYGMTEGATLGFLDHMCENNLLLFNAGGEEYALARGTPRSLIYHIRLCVLNHNFYRIILFFRVLKHNLCFNTQKFIYISAYDR